MWTFTKLNFSFIHCIINWCIFSVTTTVTVNLRFPVNIKVTFNWRNTVIITCCNNPERFGPWRPVLTWNNSTYVVHLNRNRICVFVLFQLQSEFVRMTRVNMVESLQQFWTAQRVDIAVSRLQPDKVAGDIVSAAKQTNVIGMLIFFCVHKFFLNKLCKLLPMLDVLHKGIRCMHQELSSEDLMLHMWSSTIYGFIVFWGFLVQAVLDGVQRKGKIINKMYCQFLKRTKINYLYILEQCFWTFLLEQNLWQAFRLLTELH